MAATYQSIATTNLAGTGNSSTAHSLVVTKPTGLTAGDFMVALVGTSNSADITTATTGSDAVMAAAGWTKIGQSLKTDQTPDACIAVYSKYATAGDAAASNFTLFDMAGGVTDNFGGAIIRFSSDSSADATFADFDTTEDTNPTTVTVTGGVDPTVADNILVMLGMIGSSDGSNALSISNYAVTTDNPTWTERFDSARNTDGDSNCIFIATAPRSATTATGNYTFDVAGDGAGDVIYGAVCLLAVQTPTSVTVSPAVITMTLSVQAPSIVGDANVSPSVITMTASIQAPTVTTAANPWAETSKTATSWVETPKS